jgi:WD40 repeat protein
VLPAGGVYQVPLPFRPRPTYDAFISYSHGADNRLAPALRDGLQKLAKPWWRRRAMNVFHDKSNLHANPDLFATVHEALVRSGAFILLASQGAAASPWVAKEVEAWLQANHWPPGTRNLRPDRPILIVLTDGEIAWNAAGRDFDWARTTALPRVLSGVFTNEPLWVDLRWARSAVQLSLRYPLFRDAVASVAATVRHKSKDDLLGEDLRTFRRARRLAWSAASVLAVLTVLSCSLGVVANVQSRVANHQRAVAQAAQRLATGRALQAEALLYRDTDPQLSLRLSLAALAVSPNPTAHADLVNTLEQTHFDGGADLDGGDHPGGLEVATVGPGGVALVTDVPISERPPSPPNADKASEPADLIVWDIADPRHPTRASKLTGHTGVSVTATFSSDGKLLVTTDQTSAILWDIADLTAPKRLATLSGLDTVRAAAVSPNRRTLALVGGPITTLERDGWLGLWDIADPTHPRSLSKMTGVYDAGGLAFSPDNDTLVTATGQVSIDTGTGDTTSSGATVWDVGDRSNPRKRVRIGLATSEVALSPTRPLLALPYRDIVRLYDLSDPGHPHRLPDLAGPLLQLESVAFSRDGRTIAGTSLDKTTTLWNVSDPEKPANLTTLRGAKNSVVAAGFSSDGSTVTTVDTNATLSRWRVGGNEPVVLSTVTAKFGVNGVAISPAGDRIAVATAGVAFSKTGTVELWDVTDPSRPVSLSTLTDVPGGVETVAFSSDGKLLATGGWIGTNIDNLHAQGRITLWDVTDARHPRAIVDTTTPSPVYAVGFHPSQPILAAVGAVVFGDGWSSIWNVSDPKTPKSLASAKQTGLVGGTMGPAQFSPDGSLLALADAIWDMRNPDKPAMLDTGFVSPTPGSMFTPDNQVLVSPGSLSIQLWDLQNQSAALPLARTPTQTPPVRAARLDPDGDLLAVGNLDGTLDIWDIVQRTNPTLAFSAHPHADSIEAVAFSPDGNWFVTGAFDATVDLWSAGRLGEIVPDPTALACRLAGGLTKDEWNAHAPDTPYVQTCP